ncbi:MAG: restriction endonuclease [Flavobacteriales bacterium]
MAKRKTITVFEHQKLMLSANGLMPAHVQRLLAWNETNGNQYFSFGLKSITFTQYVGVIQVGDRVIEVLPKADRTEPDTEETRDKWQRSLLTMLRAVHDLPLTSTTESHLQKRRSTVLDFFFGLYVRDIEGLVRRGLVKRYRRTKANSTALKGRLDFPRHIQQNLIHQERFFVEHQVYDTDHLLHALLKKALSIVKGLAQDPVISSQATGIEWAFEQVADRRMDPVTLDRIILDRKTEPYARAMQLAKMIVQNYAPDIKGGHMPLIGLMFDMNVLFEQFVYRVLRKAQPAFSEQQLTVRGQTRQKFWRNKTIRPDIVLEYTQGGASQKVIVDTKWKVPANGKPNDADLKQMFVYNVQFDAAKSVLLYPHVPSSTRYDGSYVNSVRLPRWEHLCCMEYADLFSDNGTIRPNAGNVILSDLVLSGM